PRRQWSRAESNAGPRGTRSAHAIRGAPRSGLNWPQPSRGRPPRRGARGNARPWRAANLPLRVRIGARQELHDGEQMPEMLAVMAAPAAEDRPLLGWCLELRLGEHGRDCRAIFVLEVARIGRDA